MKKLNNVKPQRSYDSSKNKAICYFSASSTGDFQQLYDFGIREILVSYFYIRKSLSYWEKMLPKFKSEGGIFMTDSGAFSFMGKYQEGTSDYEKMCKEESWLDYLNEYIEWVKAHKDYIFSAANLDIDNIVGTEVVDKWNKNIFEPLEKISGVQVVYVAHEVRGSVNEMKSFMERFKHYCEHYKYVGANQRWKKCSAQIYQMVKRYNVRIHGFAWTELPLLRKHPFFSVDSVSWLSGVRFGTTYDYDGKNFRTLDTKKKYQRKARAVKFRKEGIDMEGLKQEKRIPVNQMNLIGWMGFRKEYLKVANLKLHNKVVSYYEKRDS